MSELLASAWNIASRSCRLTSGHLPLYRQNTMNDEYRSSAGFAEVLKVEVTRRDLRWPRALFAAMAMLVCGCAKDEGVVHIDGSSTVFPIMSAVASQFQRAELTKVSIAVSGTLGGFRKLCAGQTDVTGASRPITTSENDVETDELALGFFGYMYYAKNKDKLRALAVDDGNSSNGLGPILPSPESVQKGTYQPLSRPRFVYVAENSLSRAPVAAFLNFYLERGWKLVGQVGYIPLPSHAYALGMARVSARTTGSLFGGKGSEVGVSVADLLQKESSGRQ
jgi:hypothetical protein